VKGHSRTLSKAAREDCKSPERHLASLHITFLVGAQCEKK
jgi:hypothetical protein